MHREREIERVENDHFSGDACRHRHPEYRTLDYNVRHNRSLGENRSLEERPGAPPSHRSVSDSR